MLLPLACACTLGGDGDDATAVGGGGGEGGGVEQGRCRVLAHWETDYDVIDEGATWYGTDVDISGKKVRGFQVFAEFQITHTKVASASSTTVSASESGLGSSDEGSVSPSAEEPAEAGAARALREWRIRRIIQRSDTVVKLSLIHI